MLPVVVSRALEVYTATGLAAPQFSILPWDTMTWLRSPRLYLGDDPTRNSGNPVISVAIKLRNSWDRVGRGQAGCSVHYGVQCDLREVMDDLADLADLSR